MRNFARDLEDIGAPEEKTVHIRSIVHAMDDLPVLARLHIVKNLIFDRGGDQASVPQDTVLITATNILTAVMTELEEATPKRRGKKKKTAKSMPQPK